MPTSLVEQPHIFQSPVIYKKPDEIRLQWNIYLKERIENDKMPTKAGVCFALKIHRKEWNKLKTHPVLSVAIDWIETVIEDAWLQKLVKTGASNGALAYLRSHYSEQYGDVSSPGDMPIPIINVVNITAVQNNIQK